MLIVSPLMLVNKDHITWPAGV